MRPRYVPIGCTTNFSFGFISRKTASFKVISLAPIKTGYIVNVDGVQNTEEIFDH